ncbi:MAG: hypothetical protein ACRCV9_18065 [Burkholderiaceae bacterium]
MRTEAPDQLFFALMIVWVIFACGSGLFFLLSKNPSLKRKLWLPSLISAGVLFIGIGIATGAPSDSYFVLIPAVALITWLNWRAVKFCDSCGSTAYSQNPFAQQRFCSKCGAKFD